MGEGEPRTHDFGMTSQDFVDAPIILTMSERSNDSQLRWRLPRGVRRPLRGFPRPSEAPARLSEALGGALGRLLRGYRKSPDWSPRHPAEARGPKAPRGPRNTQEAPGAPRRP